MEKEFTREYWQSQMMEFRDMMGSREHMNHRNRMETCINALIYCYLHADTGEGDAALMHATLIEYTRRQELWDRFRAKE